MEMTANSTEHSKLQKLVLNKWFWLVFCMFFFTYPLIRSFNRTLPPPLPVIASLPEFNFTDENGDKFSKTNFNGRFTIVNFHFTSCPTTCPKIMGAMRKIQKRVRGLGQKVQLLSITVDPETDTQKVLFKMARDYKANPYIWRFIRGSEKATQDLLVNGFMVPAGEDKIPLGDDVNVYDIVHSQKLVLVDNDGNIRGYYSSEDKVDVDRMMIDLGVMINRKKES